jgi:DNA repair ATPase RecN
MQLSKSQRFLQEYEDFKNKIEKVSSPEKKKELIDLLNQMVNEVRALDNKHNEISQFSKLPSSVGDIRENLFNIRKTLSNRLSSID